MLKSLIFIIALLLNMSVSVAFAETSATAPEKNAAEKTAQTVQTVCAACHGADGNSLIALNPKLISCLSKYSGCCPANFGLSAIALLPSAP